MNNTISTSTMAMQQPSYGLAGASLSSDQKQLISDTLSEFDVNNLTSEDALSIVSTFADAGIQAGRELAETMEAAGFDARTVGEMAGVQGPPPGQGPPSGGQGNSSGFNLSEELIQDLYTLLDQYYAENTTDEERSTLMESVRDLLGSEESMFSASV